MCLYMIAVSIYAVIDLNRKHITRDQAIDITYGKALVDCINQNKDMTSNCRRLTVSRSIYWSSTDKNPGHWCIAYEFKNPNLPIFFANYYLDDQGREITAKDNDRCI